MGIFQLERNTPLWTLNSRWGQWDSWVAILMWGCSLGVGKYTVTCAGKKRANAGKGFLNNIWKMKPSSFYNSCSPSSCCGITTLSLHPLLDEKLKGNSFWLQWFSITSNNSCNWRFILRQTGCPGQGGKWAWDDFVGVWGVWACLGGERNEGSITSRNWVRSLGGLNSADLSAFRK